MKKLYVVGLLLIAASLAGCTLNGPKVPVLTTGDAQEITWTDAPIISDSDMEEFTWDTEETAATETDEETGAAAEVKDLIDQRETQPKDESKLTEEDISLMEQIIQKVQELGN